MNRETKKLVVETVYQCVSKKYPFLKENEKFDIVKNIIKTEGFGSLFSKKPQFANNGEYAAASIKAGVDLRTGKPLDGMMKVKFNAFVNNPKYARWRSQPFSSSTVAAHPDSAAVDNMSKRQVFSAFGFSENSFQLNEGVNSVESIKSVCKSGLDKLSKNMKKLGLTPSKDNDILNIVKSAKSDEEVKEAIDKLIKDKMYYKNYSDNSHINAAESAWITYSLNRQAGRNSFTSFVLALCVLTRMYFYTLIGQNKMSRLNKYIKKTAKHPVIFTIGNIVLWIVMGILTELLAKKAITAMSIALLNKEYDKYSSIFGVSIAVANICRFIMFLYTILKFILMFFILKRENSMTDISVA